MLAQLEAKRVRRATNGDSDEPNDYPSDKDLRDATELPVGFDYDLTESLSLDCASVEEENPSPAPALPAAGSQAPATESPALAPAPASTPANAPDSFFDDDDNIHHFDDIFDQFDAEQKIEDID